MAGEAGSIERLALEIGRALGTIADQFQRPAVAFETYGLRPPEGFVDQLGTEIGAAIDAAAGLPALVTALKDAIEASDPDVEAIASAGKALVEGIKTTVQKLRDLRSALAAIGGSFPGLTPEEQAQVATFGQEFLGRVLVALVADVWRTTLPRVFAAADLIGFVEHVRDVPGAVDEVTSQTERLNLRFDLLPSLFTDPAQYLQDAYGWGTTNFKAELLLRNFHRFLEDQIEVPAKLIFVTGLPPALEGFLFNVTVDDQDPPGLRVDLRIKPDEDFDFGGSLTENWDLDFTVTAQFEQDVSVGIRPPFALAFEPFAGTTASLDLSLGIARAATAGPLLLIGQTGGSRLEVGSASLAFLAKGQWSDTGGASVEPGLSGALGQGLVLIKAGDSDGFLSKILGGRDLEGHFDLGFDWSPSGGLKLHGAGQLEITLPASVSIGPVRLSAIHLAAGLGASGLTTAISATADATLGPITVAVDRIGLTGDLTFPSNGGNLGPLDLDVGFKFPNGVGISVNGGAISGGGFLAFEPGKYSGAIELEAYSISIKAFGLIETGAAGAGFSFVIVISTEFATPIQLGLGFTLNGVGGLIGINRTVNSDALRALVVAGRTENLLFPKNVIANAPAIIRDLGTVFPAREGHYVFGPLAKLGWGTPTLITAELALILELPGPVLTLIGEVKCLLPKPDVALVKFNLSIAGQLDFPRKSFSLDAALHDSVIEGYPVSGQMAMRLRWGEQPNFALSIGGFHPAYQPPPNFPKLQPMTVALAQQGSTSVTISGFFALTSNTLQIGGEARLHAGGSGISLDASIAVKTIFIFSPFSFVANVDASVKISFHGHGPSVHLSGILSGPSPWRAKGEVCVSILWWDACLRFDQTFGGTTTVPEPVLDPWLGSATVQGLKGALQDAKNWAALPPAGSFAVVSRAAGANDLVDPLGGFTVRQKAVPVETTLAIARFGPARAAEPATARTGPIFFKGATGSYGTSIPLAQADVLKDFFAPAQFFELNDAKKLSAKSFDKYGSGYSFAIKPGNIEAGSIGSRQIQYTTVILGSGGTVTDPTLYDLPPAHLAAKSATSAVAKGGFGQSGSRRYIDPAFTQPFDINDVGFALANADSLQAITPGAPPLPRADALVALDDYIALHPEKRGQVQVVATYELAA